LIGGGELQPMLTASNIRITGWLMNREQLLNHLIKLMFIYKHPFGKVLPIAVLEAMALQNQ
jgi:hypothetical protein